MSSSYIIILIIMLAASYFLFVRKPKASPRDPELSKPKPDANSDQDESGEDNL